MENSRGGCGPGGRPPLAPDSESSGLFGDHLLAASLVQNISQRLSNRVHAGPFPIGASDACQGPYRLLGGHTRPERIGEELGHGVEDGRAAVSGLAEPDKGLEGVTSIVGGDGDVYLAAVGVHLVGDAGKGLRARSFHGGLPWNVGGWGLTAAGVNALLFHPGTAYS